MIRHLTLHTTNGDIEFVEKQFLRNRSWTFGQIKSDYETIWHMLNDRGDPVTISGKSRPERNEILALKKPGSSYENNGRSAPATERIDTPAISFYKDLQYTWILTNCNGVLTDQAKSDADSAMRSNAFLSNGNGSDLYTLYYPDGTTNGMPIAGMKIQPMSMGGSLHRIVDKGTGKKDVVTGFPIKLVYVECMHHSQVRDFTDVKKFPWLWPVMSNSRRNKIYERKPDGDMLLLRIDQHYQEPMRYFGERGRIPMLGSIKSAQATETGYMVAIPESRINYIESNVAIPNPWVMADNRKIENPFEGF